MLRYRDFVPAMHKPPSLGFFGGISYGEFDSFDATVEKAGKWIEKRGIRVIHVETVLLSDMKESSQPVGLAAPYSKYLPAIFWRQFVRVWYEDEGGRRAE